MSRRGFSLIELLVVIVVGGVLLTVGGLLLASYAQRSAGQRAAQLFARDLVTARSYAVRTQDPVVLRFYESTRWYEFVTATSGSEVTTRRFGGSGDIDLSGMVLDAAGDSLVFFPSGMLDMSGVGGTLGTARFSSGPTTYTVSFNGMGASKIDQT